MKYVCELCGFVYDETAGDPGNGVAAGTAFADLPADYTCPACGSEKEAFYRPSAPAGTVSGTKEPQERQYTKYPEEYRVSDR